MKKAIFTILALAVVFFLAGAPLLPMSVSDRDSASISALRACGDGVLSLSSNGTKIFDETYVFIPMNEGEAIDWVFEKYPDAGAMLRVVKMAYSEKKEMGRLVSKINYSLPSGRKTYTLCEFTIGAYGRVYPETFSYGGRAIQSIDLPMAFASKMVTPPERLQYSYETDYWDKAKALTSPAYWK